MLKKLALWIPHLHNLHEERNRYAAEVAKLNDRVGEIGAANEHLQIERDHLQSEVAELQTEVVSLKESIQNTSDIIGQLSNYELILIDLRRQLEEASARENAFSGRVFRNPVGEPYWSVSLESEIQHLHRKVNNLLRRNAPRKRIRCLFVVHFANNWTALEPIYRAMLLVDDFEAFVVVVDYSFYGKDDVVNCDELSRMLSLRNIPHFRWGSMSDYEVGSNEGNYLLHHLAPDIVFRQSPYDGSVPSALWTSHSAAYRICYVPYGLETVQTPSSTVNTGFFHSAWRVFACSEKQADYFRRESLLEGMNVRVTGNPRLDEIASRSREQQGRAENYTVLWAPHHSVGEQWLSFGTFPESCWKILEFARSYSNLNFVLRGHHILYKTLLNMGAMTAEEVSRFRDEWSSLGNTSVEEGACYVDAFTKSDVLLSDGVSFIAEYQVTGKPVVFIEREGHVDFNVLGKVTVQGTYRVPTAEKAIEKILSLKEGGDDALKRARGFTDAELRPYPGAAAERILHEIRTGIADET